MFPSQTKSLACHLLLFLSISSLVECDSIHLWDGKIVYFQEKDRNLSETIKACNQLGGQLPSVHSEEDIEQISALSGSHTRLWLGAKAEDKSSSPNERVYEWLDGSPFDYLDWWDEELCSASCCGVGLSYPDPFGNRLWTPECDNNRSMICVLPVLTNASVQNFIKSQMPSLDSLLQNTSSKFYEHQEALLLLNMTMVNLQESDRHFSTQMHQLWLESHQNKLNLDIVASRANVAIWLVASLVLALVLVFLINTGSLPFLTTRTSNVPSNQTGSDYSSRNLNPSAVLWFIRRKLDNRNKPARARMNDPESDLI